MNRTMDNTPNSKSNKVFSPSRTVWRTQMTKGVYTPHRVSRITCFVNQLISQPISDFLFKLGVISYIENGRSLRNLIQPRKWGLSGEIISLQSTLVNIFRFTVPRENALDIIKALINLGQLHLPGRGTIFSQDLMEFCHEPPAIDTNFLSKANTDIGEAILLDKLDYVTGVLSMPGSGEYIAKEALELGICVPFITLGTGNDMRDQLGLIRITISPQKELVHMIIPEHDSQSTIKLLVEHGKLDKPGRGYIYQTPVSIGMLDTRIRIGSRDTAASLEQIIAAIDQLKGSATWRKRLNTEEETRKINSSMMPQDNCEVSIISEEDRIDILREVCMEVGALGATTSRVTPRYFKEEVVSDMIRSAISVPANMIDNIVDKLLDASTIKENNTDRIQILDSPMAYVRDF